MPNAGANAELAAATGENASANFASERRLIIEVVISLQSWWTNW